jgi:hypothetical protein
MISLLPAAIIAMHSFIHSFIHSYTHMQLSKNVQPFTAAHRSNVKVKPFFSSSFLHVCLVGARSVTSQAGSSRSVSIVGRRQQAPTLRLLAWFGCENGSIVPPTPMGNFQLKQRNNKTMNATWRRPTEFACCLTIPVISAVRPFSRLTGLR